MKSDTITIDMEKRVVIFHAHARELTAEEMDSDLREAVHILSHCVDPYGYRQVSKCS